MTEAHYTNGKQATVCIARNINGQRTWIAERLPVSGKREARAVAKAHGAEPWNF
jgi:hypothetical protein